MRPRGSRNKARRELAAPSSGELLAAREKFDLSMIEAAALIWCSREAWQTWESGKRKMHPCFWWSFLTRAKQYQVRKAREAREVVEVKAMRLGTPHLKRLLDA